MSGLLSICCKGKLRRVLDAWITIFESKHTAQQSCYFIDTKSVLPPGLKKDRFTQECKAWSKITLFSSSCGLDIGGNSIGKVAYYLDYHWNSKWKQ